jgi:micrococcal nuclease
MRIRHSFIVRAIALAGCLLVVTSCTKVSLPTGQPVTVGRVVNGNTIEITSQSDNLTVLKKVRLIGITAPDLQQDPWGIQAKIELEKLTLGKQLLLETDTEKSDRWQNQQGYLWQENLLINEHLVKQGFVLAEEKFPNRKYSERLAHAQEWARIMGLGIWRPESPMRLTPQEFRSQNSSTIDQNEVMADQSE